MKTVLALIVLIAVVSAGPLVLPTTYTECVVGAANGAYCDSSDGTTHLAGLLGLLEACSFPTCQGDVCVDTTVGYYTTAEAKACNVARSGTEGTDCELASTCKTCEAIDGCAAGVLAFCNIQFDVDQPCDTGAAENPASAADCNPGSACNDAGLCTPLTDASAIVCLAENLADCKAEVNCVEDTTAGTWSCPAATDLENGTECNSTATEDVCETAGVCTAGVCGDRGFKADNVTCGSGKGFCKSQAYCDGSSSTCPEADSCSEACEDNVSAWWAFGTQNNKGDAALEFYDCIAEIAEKSDPEEFIQAFTNTTYECVANYKTNCTTAKGSICYIKYELSDMGTSPKYYDVVEPVCDFGKCSAADKTLVAYGAVKLDRVGAVTPSFYCPSPAPGPDATTPDDDSAFLATVSMFVVAIALLL